MKTLPDDAYNQAHIDWPDGPRCGAPACIAGHATWLAGMWNPYGRIIARAAEWLGLDKRQACPLFEAIPQGMDDVKLTPRDAAATLRHLAETGEVRWQRTKE